MKSVLRVVALIFATAWLMGQASCMNMGGGTGHSTPPPRGSTGGWTQTTGGPVPDTSGRWTAVVWAKPSTYKPAAQARSCNAGYQAVSYPGGALCQSCLGNGEPVFATGELWCGRCPTGYRVTIYQGKHYCRG